MTRESSQCRKWEQERRDRFKNAFSQLAKVLPCYDPLAKISKIDILQKATSNIQELQDKVNNLLSDTEENSERESTIKKLQDRIKKLLVRNEQLNNLLRDAGISVPTVCGTVKRFKTLPWSRRISPEQAKLLQKSEIERKNGTSKVNKVVSDKKKKTKTLNTNIAPKHRAVVINGTQEKGTIPKKRKIYRKTSTSNCLILLSQTPTARSNYGQQCFLITNQLSKGNRRKATRVQKSGVNNHGEPINSLIPTRNITTSNMYSYIKPPLGPGTLILSNGTVMSILPQSPTLVSVSNLTTNSPIYTFNKTPQINNITLKDAVQKNAFHTKKGLTLLRPKYCLTKTTQVNKVPIPALTSRYANYFPLNENKPVNLKIKNNAATLEKVKPDQKIVSLKGNNVKPTDKDQKLKRKTEDDIEVNCKKSKIESISNNKIIEDHSTSPSNPSVTCNDNLQNIRNNKNQCVVVNSTEFKENNNSMKKIALESENAKINKDVEKQNIQAEIPQSINISENFEKGEDLLEVIKYNSKEQTNTSAVTTINSNTTTPAPTSVPAKEADVQVCPEANKVVTVTINTTINSIVTATTVTTDNVSNPIINTVVNNINNCAVNTDNNKVNITTSTNGDDIKNLDLNLSHSEFSNDIFASLQVPSGCQNPESTSPTAAFLLAFPLVSSGIKVTEVIDEDNSESQRGTPTLLQIGTMDSAKTTRSDTVSSNLLNLDNFSFFSSKDICGNYYNTCTNPTSKVVKPTSTTLPNVSNIPVTNTDKSTYVNVNVKTPCLPTNVEQIAKENYNVFNEKGISSSKDSRPLDVCGKERSIQKINNKFSSHSLPESKSDMNPKSNLKENDNTHKNCTQKSQYYMPTTYSNSTCNLHYKNDPAKICTTCSYVNINRNYSNPLYTNCNNYSYNYPDTNFNQNYYKNLSQNENKSYYPLNYDNYADYHKTESTFGVRCYETNKEKKTNNTSKIKTNQNKAPINWMTTLDNRLQTSECMLTHSKGDFNQSYPLTSYATSSSRFFSSSSMDTNNVNCLMEGKKCLDIPMASLNAHQRSSIEEKQFSWSPTKLPHFLDPPPPNFVSSTLPTLVGDLALGNPLTFGEQKNDFKFLKDTRRISKSNNCENQNNFLSVSQLVDHNKADNLPAKTSVRRNSGNRSQKIKRAGKHENKDLLSNCTISSEKVGHIRPNNNYISFENETFSDPKNRNSQKNTTSSYSAEALIGNQVQDESVIKKYPPPSSKSLGVPSFLTENIIPYFPPVDFPQENFIPHNQSYQTNNFTHSLSTSFQNNTYSTNSFIYTASTIPSTYLSTTNFDTGAHDYLQDNLNLIANTAVKDNKQYTNKSYNNKQSNKEEKNNQNIACFNNLKKTRKKHGNDTNGLATFDFPFLSIPPSNNSPILPDDFHTHSNFLPPPTPFSCKNALYPSKQNIDISTTSLLPPPTAPRSTIQHPEISPSVNSAGTSLTNFNLSTIFPEINKGHISEIYHDARMKDNHTKNYTSAPPHMSFNSEPKFSFST